MVKSWRPGNTAGARARWRISHNRLQHKDLETRTRARTGFWPRSCFPLPVSRHDSFPLIMGYSMASATHDTTDDVPAELQALIGSIGELPAAQQALLKPVADKVVQCSIRRRRILNLVQEALSQLRLDMKYLVFDLEATRRERDELRRRLSEIEGAGEPEDPEGNL